MPVCILLAAASGLAGCQSAAPDTPIAFLSPGDGVWQACLFEPAATQPRCLTHLSEDVVRLSWYPNGRDLLLNLQNGRLMKLDTRSGAITPIRFPVDGVVDAAISPDGHQIAYSVSLVDSGDRNDIWTFDLTTGTPSKRTTMPGLQHNPVWSADGKALYFLSGGGPQAHDIWRLDLASGNREQLTVGTRYHFDPAVRGDGMLAYSGNAGGDYDLWLQPSGGKPEALMDDPALDAQPTWSPSGQSLVFASTREGDVDQLWRYDLSSKRFTRLTQLPGGARMPQWAPTGEDR
jgi:Tol biopolymer transport system component